MPTTGVVIGRFQVDELHEGHRNLIKQVSQECSDLLILIGTRPTSNASSRDPLDFQTRLNMLAEKYPSATIKQVIDHPSDQVWSKNVDALIAQHFPNQPARLYGSRQSFIPYYSGQWPVIEINPIQTLSGSDLRKRIMQTTCATAHERKGMIRASMQRFPTSYQVVDIAVIKKDKETYSVLLGKKDIDDGYRLIGGFVDPSDDTLETAAVRELREEVGELNVTNIRYVTSMRVNDVRYRNQPDQIMTAIFIADYVKGEIDLSDKDELVSADWYPIEFLKNQMATTHKPLGNKIWQALSQ